MTWLNEDGLYIKFGAEEGVSNQQGGHRCYPPLKYWLNLDLTRLDETETIQNDVLVIPKDSLILSVEVITVVAAATGTAIDVGLIANDRTTTTNLNASITDADPNGLLAAFPAAEMSEAGEYSKFWTQTAIPAAATGSGALLGTILTVPTLFTASATTATAFTAGQLLIGVTVIPEALVGFDLVH